MEATKNCWGTPSPSTEEWECSNPNKWLEMNGWMDRQPATDPGHLRFRSHGAVAFRILERWLIDTIRNLSAAQEIVAPTFYLSSDSRIAGQSGRFFADMYHGGLHEVLPKYVARANGDYAALTLYDGLDKETAPIRVFEMVPAHRYIQKGQLDGLKTARAFHMLDFHSVCENESDLKDEWRRLISWQGEFLKRATGNEPSLHIDVSRQYLLENSAFFSALETIVGNQVTIRPIDQLKNYWTAQHRFSLPEGTPIADGQIDHTNGKRYGMTTGTGLGQYALICHGAWGTVERWLWFFVKRAIAAGSHLPVWLSPVQLRFIPCSHRGLATSNSLLATLNRYNVRADIDGSPASIGKRITVARDSLIPFISVVGDRETDTGDIKVRMCTTSNAVHSELSIDELIAGINQETRWLSFSGEPT